MALSAFSHAQPKDATGVIVFADGTCIWGKGFGATGTGLDIDESIVGIEFTGEHAAKLEAADLGLELSEIAVQFICRVFVVFFDCKFEQLGRIRKARGQPVKRQHHALELCPLLAKLLGSFWVVPDIRVFQFALNLGQALRLAFIVKDTPLTRWCVR